MQLAEVLEVVDRQVVAGQVQQGVDQHRAVAVGQHEAVAVGPFGVGWVVLEVMVPGTSAISAMPMGAPAGRLLSAKPGRVGYWTGGRDAGRPGLELRGASGSHQARIIGVAPAASPVPSCRWHHDGVGPGHEGRGS